MLVETLLHTRSKASDWEWVANYSTVSGVEAIWSLQRQGRCIRYASIHPRQGKFIAFIGGDMFHSASAETLSECARKVEELLGVK